MYRINCCVCWHTSSTITATVYMSNLVAVRPISNASCSLRNLCSSYQVCCNTFTYTQISFKIHLPLSLSKQTSHCSACCMVGFPLTHWPSLLARFAIALQLTCACSGVYIPLARAALTHLIIGLTSGAPQGAEELGVFCFFL